MLVPPPSISSGFPDDPDFQAMQIFDQDAVSRRVGQPSPQQLETQFRHRQNALKCFRGGDIYDPHLSDALWNAYPMVLEDDGKNSALLVQSGLLSLLKTYMRQRLAEGSADNDGWPLENEMNCLVITVFSLLSSQPSLQTESSESIAEMHELLAPYVFAGFRYPCTHTSRSPSVNGNGHDKRSDHSLLRPLAREITYFGRVVTVRLQPIALSAILLYFSSHELLATGIPSHLPPTRAAAKAASLLGPTLEDVEHFSNHCRTRLIGSSLPYLPGSSKSRLHDPDWVRTTCGQSFYNRYRSLFYETGTLSGSWCGSYLAPDGDDYTSWLSNTAAPSSFQKIGRQPCYFTLREYHCYSPCIPVPLDEDGELPEFWLKTCRWTPSEQDGGIDISDERKTFTAHYETVRRERIPAVDSYVRYTGGSDADGSVSGATHVILVGETESRYGEAWGAFRFIGQIRPSDGMITLLRETNDPSNLGLGRAIFKGYVLSSQNFVGRWQHADPNGGPPWEAAFSLCKERPNST